jgi:hypothetical protein
MAEKVTLRAKLYHMMINFVEVMIFSYFREPLHVMQSAMLMATRKWAGQLSHAAPVES